MNISRTAVFTLLILDAALGGVNLRSALAGDARIASADTRGTRAPKESAVVDREAVPGSAEAGGERSAANDAIPSIHVTVGGEPVELTVSSKSAVRIEVSSRHAPTDADAVEHKTNDVSSNDATEEDDDTPNENAEPSVRPSRQSSAPESTDQDEWPVDPGAGGRLERLLAREESARDQLTRDQPKEDESPPVPAHNFIIAQDGSIVLIGSGAELTANTGPSSASGSIAVGVTGSALKTGSSGPPAIAADALPPPPIVQSPLMVARPPWMLAQSPWTVAQSSPLVAPPPPRAAPRPVRTINSYPLAMDPYRLAIGPFQLTVTDTISRADATARAQQRLATEQPLDPRYLRVIRALQARGFLQSPNGATTAAIPPNTPPGSDSLSHANASFLAMFPWRIKPDATGVAINGFEDHSVSAIGNDEILTYDDSNVFIQRNGQINANTGDTDSSGLNAVDVRHSRVKSGDSNGGDNSDEQSNEGTKQPPEETAPTAPAAPTLPPVRQLNGRAWPRHARGQAEDGSPPADTAPPPHGAQYPGLKKGQSFASVSDEGPSTAIGKNTFVVGGDGFDDVSIRSSGDGNVVTYDDSNLIIGGTGKVNAQIGDSDTGGAVVMDINDSDVGAGCEGEAGVIGRAPPGHEGRSRTTHGPASRSAAGSSE